jgi:hypothetical protein
VVSIIEYCCAFKSRFCLVLVMMCRFLIQTLRVVSRWLQQTFASQEFAATWFECIFAMVLIRLGNVLRLRWSDSKTCNGTDLNHALQQYCFDLRPEAVPIWFALENPFVNLFDLLWHLELQQRIDVLQNGEGRPRPVSNENRWNMETREVAARM